MGRRKERTGIVFSIEQMMLAAELLDERKPGRLYKARLKSRKALVFP